jgi:hypothetical protein
VLPEFHSDGWERRTHSKKVRLHLRINNGDKAALRNKLPQQFTDIHGQSFFGYVRITNRELPLLFAILSSSYYFYYEDICYINIRKASTLPFVNNKWFPQPCTK